ncbi:RNA-binding protein 41-like isoform X1 [Vanessa cardui]|uniref:RNA-binding protein 41-like isoform X1 n=1 Tax=Vanessa cardui TaxID=171605 RepID=UPI001F12D0A0|nr:RNA-binding protein 41-like isoform X1 [Vanessa cardui]
MCSEMPKEFQKTSEVLPFTKYGISTAEEFRKVEKDIQHLECLKKIGLTNDEIKLYQENEAGLLDQRKKIESNVLKSKLEGLYNKINDFQNASGSSQEDKDTPTTSNAAAEDIINRIHKHPMKFYPEGHPMNELKEIEEELFGHLKNDNLLPITKRRKILRRLERKKEKILLQQKDPGIHSKDPIAGPSKVKPGSLWDVKDMPGKVQRPKSHQDIIGPKRQTMYTVKENKIVRLEPVQHEEADEYRAVDIVVPINAAEEQLLEGTKMCLDDIKKIERFKDYEPGIPSKVLFLKNISPSVPQEQLMLLFNQFHLENGGPVDLRLMTGRMRGQAFVTFQSEDLAIQALEEVNGTILDGRPIIAQFGRNSNRIQMEENR